MAAPRPGNVPEWLEKYPDSLLKSYAAKFGASKRVVMDDTRHVSDRFIREGTTT